MDVPPQSVRAFACPVFAPFASRDLQLTAIGGTQATTIRCSSLPAAGDGRLESIPSGNWTRVPQGRLRLRLAVAQLRPCAIRVPYSADFAVRPVC